MGDSARLVAGPARHIVAGTDTMSDLTEFQMRYDINSDQLKHRVVFKLGVNIAYLEVRVLSKNAHLVSGGRL